ncbi:MAG TPA: YciI family protein [Nocardioides sp.]
MKRYLFLIAYEPGGWEHASAEEQQVFVDQHQAFSDYVELHGREISAAALAGPDTATTVRHESGKLAVNDGPFAETVEMIGGYYDVELPDLDHATAAAGLLPPCYSVEIQPTVVIA